MKMISSVALILVGFSVALLLLHGGVLTVAADCQDEPCEDPPCCNGDVNADGSLNLADAVYILQYLFLHGPKPAAVKCAPCHSCCPPCSGRLPATGQTRCYDEVGNEIDCESAEYPGQDGFYQAGCLMEGRFVDHGDGTVTDSCTGLMWQRETAPGTYTWQQALSHCQELEHAGYQDWRLPNVMELVSILDYGRWNHAAEPLFVVEEDPVDGRSWYWSSTTFVGMPTSARIADFERGGVNRNVKTTQYFVRAVRGGLSEP